MLNYTIKNTSLVTRTLDCDAVQWDTNVVSFWKDGVVIYMIPITLVSEIVFNEV